MKKLFAVALSSLVLVGGCVSASADKSVSVAPESDSSKTSSTSTSSSSPKTGSAGTYAILMAGAALAFGGVAAGAKKKISK